MCLQLTEMLFQECLKKIAENDNKMSEEVIENLFSLFHLDFIESIELIDENCISLLRSRKSREIFEVEVESKSNTTPNRYFCLIDTNHCSCDAFRRGLLNESVLLCKHLIASKLSNAIKCYKTVEKTDKEMDRIFKKHIFN